MIPELVRRDVKRVRREAEIVLEVRENFIRETKNPDPGLQVIAVVGSGEAFGRQFDEALLSEIGQRKSRPYHEAYARSKTPAASHIGGRRNWLSLSEEQYRAVAPVVFNRLQCIADERFAAWKCGPGNPFYVRTHRAYYSRKQRRIFASENHKPQPRGTRFSVSVSDEFFLRDVYYAERELNVGLGRHMRGLARYLDLLLHHYGKSRKGFRNPKCVGAAKDRIETSSLSRTPYLLAEMMEHHLPHGRKNGLWREIADLIEWDGKKTRQMELAESALDRPEVRLGSIQLRVIREYETYTVFEVFPGTV
ncbi:MAG: hypothetical protein HY435_02155 [Candidatus Liptonbacteria bacterium]|nr:hypothetical protein [Candidatus Liptonbacteria bacterium]